MAFRLINFIRKGYFQMRPRTAKQQIQKVCVTREIFKYMMKGGHLTSEMAADLWGTHSLSSRISELRRAMEKNNSPLIICNKNIDARGHKEYWIQSK